MRRELPAALAADVAYADVAYGAFRTALRIGRMAVVVDGLLGANLPRKHCRLVRDVEQICWRRVLALTVMRWHYKVLPAELLLGPGAVI